MIKSLIISIIVIVSLMITWIMVQSLWRMIFSDHITDEDVLADRRSCANCGCTKVCDRKSQELNHEQLIKK